MPYVPRAWYALTRNRPTPGIEYAKSASWLARKWSTRSSGMTSSSMRSVSAGLRSGTWSLRSRPSTRTRGAEPTLQCRSEPPVLARACRNGITDCVGWLTP